MTKDTILKKLKELKPSYEKEGLILVGLFGSYSKETASKDSDIDILYDIDANKFCDLYPGFKAFLRLENIKKELSDIFHSDIDLATIDNNSYTFKNHVLKDVIYV